MKLHGGVWLPSHEVNMSDWMTKRNELVNGKLTYQFHKLKAAVAFCKQHRTCIDIGAHCGLWAMHLTQRFAHVHAFEPIAEHRECFEKNVLDHNRTLYPFALGAEAGSVALTIPQGSSGGTHISGLGDIPMKTLDSFALTDVDFVKIDCEGAELAVLQGAVETLRKWKPVLIVEEKQHVKRMNYGIEGTQAVDFAKSLGYVQRQVISGDFILTHE